MRWEGGSVGTGRDSDFCMVTIRGVAEQGRKIEGTSHHGSVPKAMSQWAASNCKDGEGKGKKGKSPPPASSVLGRTVLSTLVPVLTPHHCA